jgi:hypothetical protein
MKIEENKNLKRLILYFLEDLFKKYWKIFFLTTGLCLFAIFSGMGFFKKIHTGLNVDIVFQ